MWFYEIDSTKIYNLILNSKKAETFRDQQRQGRRPRLSIKDKIINPLSLTPIKKINLMEDTDE